MERFSLFMLVLSAILFIARNPLARFIVYLEMRSIDRIINPNEKGK